jgi:hypothetical protein
MCRAPGGGATSAAIGCAWVAPHLALGQVGGPPVAGQQADAPEARHHLNIEGRAALHGDQGMRGAMWRSAGRLCCSAVLEGREELDREAGRDSQLASRGESSEQQLLYGRWKATCSQNVCSSSIMANGSWPT